MEPVEEQKSKEADEREAARPKKELSLQDVRQIMQDAGGLLDAKPKQKMNPIPGFDFNDPKVLAQLAKPGCSKCHSRGFNGMILQISGDVVDNKGNKRYFEAKKLEKPIPNQCACVRKTLKHRISFDSNTGKITVHRDDA